MLRRTELVDAWPDQAKIDLDAAQQLLSSQNDSLSGVVCYHAQQCSEKALKGLLCASEMDVEKTHDLIRLLDLLSAKGVQLEELLPAATLLTPFATQFRYPGMGPKPDAALARRAVDAATTLLSRAQEILDSNRE